MNKRKLQTSLCREDISQPALSIYGGESPEKRIKRLIKENPVIIFSQPSCCMCCVAKQLLSTLGVHPTVILLEEEEVKTVMTHELSSDVRSITGDYFPAVFIGGSFIGGFESLMALHLRGHLLPRLQEVGALGLQTL